ncbi:MAG: YcnI family protein [Pseudoclavibacter sp.]
MDGHRGAGRRRAPAARSLLARIAVAVGVLAASILLSLPAAPPASAHVKVNPSSTTPGGYAVLTFTVPTESATASTTRLEVQLPTDSPFTSVVYQPVPGWQTQLVTTQLAKPLKDDDGNAITSAVTRVIWTATDGGLRPGQFGQFPLSVGPLPKRAGPLSLPAVQTYSDGSSVDWVQQAQGSAEPEHPAPSFTVGAAGSASASPTGVSVAASAAAADRARPAAADGWALGLGVAGAALALAAAGAAAVALRRTRR